MEEKRENNTGETGNEKEVALEVDFSKILNFIKDYTKKDKLSKYFSAQLNFIKQNKTLCVLLLLILLQFLPNAGFLPWGGIWMRLQAKEMPAIDGIVASNVDRLVESQVSSEINNKWPHLSEEKKNELIKEGIKTWKKDNQEEYKSVITDQTNALKEQYKFEYKGKSYPYMPDIDPYNYVRYAENYLDHGSFGDSTKDGIPWDYHAIAPIGRDADLQTKIHVLVIAYFYKLVSFFNSNIHILYTTSYLPVLFTLLSLFPIFFLTRRISNNLGAFLASNLLLVHFMFLSRTSWGYADTDFYNVFFPLLVSWLFFEAVIAKEVKNKIILAGLSALSLAIFSRTWLGWWFTFYLLLGSAAVTVAYKYFIYRKTTEEIKNITKVTIIFLLLTFIFVSFVFAHPSTFFSVLSAPFNFTSIKDSVSSGLWPNVYTTVAELSEQSIIGTLEGVGIFLLLLSIFGAAILLIKHESKTILGSFYLVIWFIVTLYASTKGTRFLLLFIPAMSMLFGIGASSVIHSLSNLSKKYLKVPKLIPQIILLLIILSLYVSPVNASYKSIFGDMPKYAGELPIVNDGWWDALNYIKDNSNESAIITSWWDFGHHFKYIADRAVTFDGASQNSPMAHWVGKLLLSNNEDEAIGILRMLDCGSNNAFEEVNKKLNSTPKSVNTLYKIITLNKDDAKEVLMMKDFTEEETEKILSYTHCEPPQAFLIASADMISKAGVWAHFGNWDFIKSDLWTNHRTDSKKEVIDYLKEEYKIPETEASTLYDKLSKIKNGEEAEKNANSWIGDWDSYVGQEDPMVSCETKDKDVGCSNGLVLINETPYFLVDQNQAIPVEGIHYIDTKGAWQDKISDQKTGIDAVLIKKGGNYESIVAQTPLAGSMFTRLFFLRGHGLKHFKLVKETNQVLQGKIYVWEVDWKGTQTNTLDGTVEKEQVTTGSTVSVNYLMWTEKGTVLDSSIQDWREKNITKDSKFEDYKTKPANLQMNENMQKDIYNSLLGIKKGEEAILTLNIAGAPLPEEAQKKFGNETIYFKLKVEKITE
ncbi:FKBP-type peptidyl-prolyl cis-trans isomerase [archaeon]|nr:FKBP-type peptidyl-prolyl cis-trans isomerase [archaeon]